MDAAGRSHDLDAVRCWYNGYSFGVARRTLLYHPWSVLNFLHDPGLGPRSFWKNSSDNALVRDLLIRHAAHVGPDVEQLLHGHTVDAWLDDTVALQRVHQQPLSVLGLLAFHGYLTPASAALAYSSSRVRRDPVPPLNSRWSTPITTKPCRSLSTVP